MRTLIVTLFVVLALAGSSFAIVDNEKSRRTLRSISPIHVIVESLGTLEGLGSLSLSAVQTDVELRLRRSGVEVSRDAPVWLHLSIDGLRQREFPIWALSVNLELVQPVRLASGTAAFAATWGTGAVLISGEGNLSGVRDRVRDLVDQFLNAYLSANPTTRGTP